MSAPKLRFKEFDTEVEVKRLGDISNIVVGFVGTVSDQYCDKSEGIPFVRTQNVRDGYFSLDNLEYVTQDFHQKNKKSQIFNGDVLIARVGANMGMVCAVENLNTEANCANVIIIKKNSQLSSEYLSLFLNSENGQKQIHSGGAGGAQAVFNTTLAKEIRFPYFPLDEQTKIASFLSAVDEKISQLTQKHELLSQYKQGMIQKLFSQQIRFKADDGSEFGEWVEWKFESCIDIFDNLRKPVSASERKTGSTPYYGANGIQSYIDGYTHDGEFILIAEDGANDLINYPIQYVNGKIWVNNHAHVVCGKTKIAKNIFLKYRLGSIDFTKYLVGGGRAKLNAGAMKEISLLLPCLAEQTKIANFLTAIDQKIEVVAQQIEQAKTWKKGLLQQMFV